MRRRMFLLEPGRALPLRLALIFLGTAGLWLVIEMVILSGNAALRGWPAWALSLAGALVAGGYSALLYLWLCTIDRKGVAHDRGLLTRYRLIFNLSPEPVLVLRDDGAIIDANRAAQQLYGYDHETFTRLRFTDLYPPGTPTPILPMTLPTYERLDAGQETYHRRNDGVVFPVTLQSLETGLEDEQVLILFVFDIGRKLQMERELESHRYNLELLVAARTGELTAVNERLQLEIAERARLQETLETTNRRFRLELAAKAERNQEITLLGEMVAVLQSCLTTEEAYAVIALFARRLFHGDAGALCIFRPSQQFLESVVTWGDLSANERAFSPDDCWALRRGAIHQVNDPAHGLFCQHLNCAPPAGYLCVPMMAQGETLGLIHLQHNPDLRELSEEERTLQLEQRRQLAGSLTEQVALALSNLMLRDTLRQQVVRDNLTGLFNRLYMEETLSREMRRALRHGTPLSLLMLDLDHFKDVNDTYGHEAGDVTLREVGALLRSQIRGEDVACRYGGEEFVLILPNASLSHVRERAEQIREALKQLRVRYRGSLLRTLSASIGIATFPDHGTSSETLLRVADRALYAAKQAGRDQVVVGHFPEDGP